MSLKRYVNSRATDYANVRTVPASVSLVFLLVTFYQFGAISPISFEWFSFTLEKAYVLPASTGAILFAAMSSETKSLEYYAPGESLAIGAMLAVVFGWTLTPPDFWLNHLPVLGQLVHDTLMAIGSPTAGMVATVIAVVGWGVLIN